MKNKIMLATFSAIFLSAIALSGCSNEEKKATASFKVQLNNLASVTSLLLATPTSLTAKLGGVDLLANCTGDQPPGTCLADGRSPDPDIWVNAGCNGDIAQCTTANTEFFELIDPTVANAVLNSQGRSVEVGVYTKVRIFFLNNDAGNALKCNGVASTDRPSVPIVLALPDAITVAAGETVTVKLNYNPSAVDCATEGSLSSAINAMTATVTKN